MKPTRFMTNRAAIADQLSVRCDQGHKHYHLAGERAADAAIYPLERCRRTCRRIILNEEKEKARLCIVQWKRARGSIYIERDDVYGKELCPKEVYKARLEELGYVLARSQLKKYPISILTYSQGQHRYQIFHKIV